MPPHKEYSTTEYGHMLILNEILFGQQQPHVSTYLDRHFHVDLSRCYLCLTGLKKAAFTGYYQLSAPAFMDLFIRCGQEVRDCLAAHGYACETQVVVYDQSKRTAIFLSPGPQADIAPPEAAGQINAIFQSAYEARGCTLDRAYTNFTALSPVLSGYDEIAPAFQRVRALAELAFFQMEPMVMTEALLDRLTVPLTREQLSEELELLGRAIDHGDTEAARALCRALFLVRLKRSFSFPLLEIALHALTQQVYRYADIYSLRFSPPPEEVLQSSQPNIELLCARAEELAAACAAAVARRGTPMSYISLEAMRYLNRNFSKALSLEAVAAHINVHPSYLSRVFSREVGQNLCAYLTALRLTRAKELLTNPLLRISDIAERVGFQTAKYFTRTFKRETGMTPQQYRISLS